MRMELRLHPTDVPRLAQVRRALSRASARARTRRVWTVLHDTPDRALAAAGLALLEQRGHWRIERLWPDGGLWPPASPAPVLDEAPTRDALTTSLPDAIAPIAVLEGRETTHGLWVAGEAVTLTVWNGAAQAVGPGDPTPSAQAPKRVPPPEVTPEGEAPEGPTAPAPAVLPRNNRPAAASRPDPPTSDPPPSPTPAGRQSHPTADLRLCHVLIEGPEPAVRAVAIHLATALRAEAPRTGLAAEALDRLSVAAIPPKRLGPPVLPRDADPPLMIGAAFRHILGHLVDVLLDLAPAATDGARGTEPVHQMRVAVRRARSAMTVFRPAIDGPDIRAASGHLKDLGARLGPTRDWDVLVTETLRDVAAAVPGNRPLARLQTAAQATRHGYQTDLGTYLNAPAFRVLGVELAWLAGAETWLPANAGDHVASAAEPPDGAARDPSGEPLAAFAQRVLQRRWRKVTAAGRSIDDLDIPALHALRLRAKRARYAAEVFATLYSGRRPSRFIRRLSRLQGHLGVLNDGAVAAELLGQVGGPRGRHGHAIGLVLGFAAARAMTVRPRILRAWKKFRRAPRFWG